MITGTRCQLTQGRYRLQEEGQHFLAHKPLPDPLAAQTVRKSAALPDVRRLNHLLRLQRLQIGIRREDLDVFAEEHARVQIPRGPEQVLRILQLLLGDHRVGVSVAATASVRVPLVVDQHTARAEGLQRGAEHERLLAVELPGVPHRSSGGVRQEQEFELRYQ